MQWADLSINGNNTLTCRNVIYNQHTRGLKPEWGDQIKEFESGKTAIAPVKIKNMKPYWSALMNRMTESVNCKSQELFNEKGRTIYISYDYISGKPGSIAEKERRMLCENGREAANDF